MTTKEDATVDNTDFIGENTTGKYLLLKIPSYEDSGTNLFQASKDTYLNLGRGMGGSGTSQPGWPATTDNAPSWSAAGLASGAATPPKNSGEDLLTFFGGYADDTRLRETAGTFNAHGTPPNESSVRSSATKVSSPTATPSATGEGRNLNVTKLIPDYVGWRDHTDGHRITTTRGDKIEIIGGNYKLVSLGRGTGVAMYEMSGGITIDNDEAPGSITSVSWRPIATGDAGEGGWKVVEQLVKANTVERYHGTKREEFYGDKLISVIGSPDEATSDLTLDDGHDGEDVYVGSTSTVSGTKNVSSWSGSDPLDSYAAPTKWDTDGAAPKLQRPDIYESKWAKSINEYVQVEGDTKSQAWFKGEHLERNIFDKGHKNETTMHGVADYYQEIWHFMGAGGFMERFEGSFLQLFTGSSTTIGFANRFELYVSVEEQLNLGFITSLSLGGKLDGSFPDKLQLDLNEEKVELNGSKVSLKDAVVSLQKSETVLQKVKTALQDANSGLESSTIAALVQIT